MTAPDLDRVEYWAAIAIVIDFAANHARHVRWGVKVAHAAVLHLVITLTAMMAVAPEAAEAAEEVVEEA